MNPEAIREHVSHFQDVASRLGVTPNVLVAALVLIVGLLVASLGQTIVQRLVQRGRSWLGGGDGSSRQVFQVERVLAKTVYWGVLLLSVMAATEVLGLPVVTRWLTEVVSYLPRIVAALLVLGLGILVSRLVRQVVTRAARAARAPLYERIGRVVEVGVLIGAGMVAVEQLGVEISFLKTTVLIVLAAALGGAALAFGLGSRQLIMNMLSAHYVQRMYQIGQTVRLQGVEGRIVRITELALVVEVEDGQVTVPASDVTSLPSTLVLGRRS